MVATAASLMHAGRCCPLGASKLLATQGDGNQSLTVSCVCADSYCDSCCVATGFLKFSLQYNSDCCKDRHCHACAPETSLLLTAKDQIVTSALLAVGYTF